ncbi:MAG: S41 family peptidase [Gemmataceae bacterium]
MLRWAGTLLLLGMMLRPAWCADQEKLAAPDAAAIAKLIKQLGSESFAERRQASQALDDLGAAGLEALEEAAANSKDAETRRQASVLVDKIKGRLAFAYRFADKVLQVAEHIHESDVIVVPQSQLVQWAVAGLVDEKTPLSNSLKKRLQAADQQDLKKLLRDVRIALAGENDPGEKDLLRALEGMVKGLQSVDPYASLFEPQQFYRDVSWLPEGIGVRIEVDERTKFIRVIGPERGGPAHRAGVQAGDLITSVTPFDEKNQAKPISTKGMAPVDFVRKITGKPGSAVLVSVRRAGKDEEIEIEIKRDRHRAATVHPLARKADDSPEYFIDRERGIAYLRVEAMRQETFKEFAEAVKQVKAAGARAVILDLRFNRGGLLATSCQLANALMTERQGVHLLTREEKRPGHKLFAAETGPRAGQILDLPMVCLVNGETAAGTEWLTAELQDYSRAAILGARTHGRGAVQNISISHGRALKLSTALYIRPTGKKIDRMAFPGRPADEWGVTPDQVVQLTDAETQPVQSYLEHLALVVREERPPDRQLEAALAYLRKN